MNATTSPLNEAQLSEAQLWVNYARNRTVQNRNRLVENHMRIAGALARNLSARIPPNPLWDIHSLTAEGTVGLMRAVERFDPARGVKFSAFAARLVAGAMLDALRGADWVPRRLRRRLRDSGSAAVEMVQMPTADPAMDGRQDSLSFEETIPDRDHAPECDPLSGEMLRGLTERERAVARLYFEVDLTIREIGRELDLSESKVSRLISSILKRLRGNVAECTPTA